MKQIEEEKQAIKECESLIKKEYYGDMYFYERRSIQIVLNLLEKQQKEIENSISKNLIKELADFAINATDLKDDYSIGMCNGMIYLKSVILNEIPIYKECKNDSIPKEQ